jgi:predicted lipoprotein with Yx(FWY)xxD motif
MKTTHLGGLVLAAGLFLAACNVANPQASGGGGYATGTTKPRVSAPTTVQAAQSKLGRILVDAQGRTLYAFTNDANGTSTCEGACADAWPPVAANGDTMTGQGVDAALLSKVTRSDGTSQLKVGKWPVYLYAGDGAPGDVNGQGSGGTWFVIGPNGSLVKS